MHPQQLYHSQQPNYQQPQAFSYHQLAPNSNLQNSNLRLNASGNTSFLQSSYSPNQLMGQQPVIMGHPGMLPVAFLENPNNSMALNTSNLNVMMHLHN